MFTDSSMKETLKCICCSNGWCYGVFWGFDKITSLLTLKDAYFEEQVEKLVDNMLLQIHVLGEGELGRAALSQNHRWIYSDAYYLDEIPRHDSDLLNQFDLGIKTIALISVESWGVFQFGSTEKISETIEFADQVREPFKGMNAANELDLFENKLTSYNHLTDSSTEFSSFSLCNIFQSSNQKFSLSEGITEQAHSLVCDQFQNGVISTNEFDQLLLETSHIFDFSGTQVRTRDADCSVLNSDFLQQQTTNDSSKVRNFPSSPDLPTRSCEDRRPYGLQTLDELFENDFSKSLMDGLYNYSPQAGPSSAELFTSLLDMSELSSVTGLIPLSDSSVGNSPIGVSDNFPTKFVQSSITDMYEPNHQKKLKNTSNTLFSKLGLDQLLDGNYNCGSGSYTAKRRKIEGYSWIHSQEIVQDMPGFDGNDGKMFNNLVNELETRSSVELISTKVKGSLKGDTKRQEEFTKTGKKKAKLGTKPRPKDRQMIQDRLGELRQLVPNGEKMSIDRLLERTIRHLKYMQSLTKYMEILRQGNKSNVQPSLSMSNGVTWACEVGDRNVVCPLIVEDLTEQGQMLVEILYQEQGFFLQIVHILRSLGLIVLKGVMEDRETKIWAHFIVEAEGNRRVTRHEIFSSLIQLLQMMTEQNAADSNDHFGVHNKSNNMNSLFNNCQPSVSFPLLNCASL